MPTRRQLANALRVLAIDAIDKAKSGHPGAPMGMADMAEALFRHAFKHSPKHPDWCDRDRFVLSNGHASSLLYGVLHLMGYDVSLDDLKNFRQLGSKTPGHPELGVTAGVDLTTGPLGQGISSAVGMAMAEKMLSASFNRDDYKIVNHFTYCFVGDGCLMEGVSAEASSLAGIWRLGKLIVFYDANGISIDGKIDGWFCEDIAARYNAYQWQVLGPIDGHDFNILDSAIQFAKAEQDKPTLIICRTHIGLGSPEVDSAKCHGAPLPAESLVKAKQSYSWCKDPFEVPQDIYAAWNAVDSGNQAYSAWLDTLEQYKVKFPELYAEFDRRVHGKLPDSFESNFAQLLSNFSKDPKPQATRKISQACIEYFMDFMPELIGGSADLSGSVGTLTKKSHEFEPTSGKGNYLYYGVREFAMACIVNGMAVHGGLMPYAGTFLSFADQAKNALRLACLMHAKTLWIFTHDSIGVGEDGPTHQPVEQIASLRLIPNMYVWRPCDYLETAFAFKFALNNNNPTSLILSRQTLPLITHNQNDNLVIQRGGYILKDAAGEPDLIFIATGSEVALAVSACELLTTEGFNVRVVSMPCTEVFDKQPLDYQETVLPLKVRKRVALEAGSADFWWKYVGLDGRVIGMRDFGLSGKASDVFKHFGFTVDHVVQIAKELLAK